MYDINEVVEIVIDRDESNFDRACDAAYNLALIKFSIDEDGYSNNVRGFDRSRDSLIVEFKSYKLVGSMLGHNHIYTFDIWVEREEEEDN